MSNTNEENRIIFRLGFCCKCGESNIDKFIINYNNETEGGVTLLCGNCERQYLIGMSSEEIPIGGYSD